jgi:beta-xylosidase
MRSQLGRRSIAWITAIVSALCALSLLGALLGTADAQAQGAEQPTCLDPRSDTFDGTSLDKNRWSRILREDTSLYSVSDGSLNVQTGPGEVQTSAPNLFLQPIPEGSWSVTTKVNIEHTPGQAGEGQQAGLLLAGEGAQDVIKVAYVNKGDQGRWIEFLKIVDGQYDFSGTWNTGHFPADFPSEIWMRLKSDGQVLSGEYSVDGENWTTIADPRNYEAIENPSIGVYALRGGAEKPVVTAEFDSFDLVPASDEFDGTEIDRCRWEVQNENPAGYSLGDGQLTIKTLRGELSNNQSTVQNVFVQPTGDSDWQATTKLTLDPQSAGQQGGLVVRGQDASNHSKIVLVRKDNGQRWIEFLRTTNGATDFSGTWNTGFQDFPETVHLRLVSNGETLSGYWSPDGETWTKVGDSRSIAGIETPKVGPMALGGENDNPPIDVAFDWFRLGPSDGEEPPPPVAPDCTTQGEPDTDFEPIFDGTQATFDDWEHAGQGFFTLNADGSMTSGNTVEEPNYGLHWYTGRQYKNFTVRMQWKAEDLTDNSGVFVRFPDPGDDPNVAVNQGHEIQINENPGGDPQKTGAIYNADPANFRNARPVGEWNDYQITVVGQRYTVCLNGKVVNDYVSDKGRPLEGYIGVQNHDPESHVSFRNIRVKELPDAPSVQNIFDTIGITTAENRANAQIHGTPYKYAYIAEQMPPSRSVGVPGDDEFDDVPLRMPDTRGVVPNLASMNGQELFLPEAQRQAYSRLHFFGATTDAQNGQPAGGDFTLTFADGTTETVTVRFRDWAASGGTEADHPAITTNPRYTTQGTQGNIDFHIFHKPMTISAANRGKVLTSIKLPPSATPGSAVTEAYLMALTLEDAEGGFEMPILGGNAEFPNDTTPPTTTATVDPAEPSGDGGWYTGPVRVTLESEDEEGGSGVETTEYRIDGGAWEPYTGDAFTVDTDGAHTVQFRAMDRAGNLETQQELSLKIDATAPTLDAELSPELPAGGEWYDRPVELTLDAFDGSGSGVEATEYAIGDGAWQAYDGSVTFDDEGTYEVRYRATDVAGNEAAAEQPLTIRIDATAPTTTAQLDGAAPAGPYTGPVSVSLSGADVAGSGVERTEYRLDGGEWAPYTGAFSVSGAGVHTLEYRSIDAARNLENAKQLAFTIQAGQQPGNPPPGTPPPGGGDDPDADPAPEPGPWAAITKPRRALLTLEALGRGRLTVTVRCQSVERGTLRLTVSRKAARRLGLRSRVLAARTVRCDGRARATVRLKPSRRVRRALADRRRALRATLTLRLSGDAGQARDTARIKLRRGGR